MPINFPIYYRHNYYYLLLTMATLMTGCSSSLPELRGFTFLQDKDAAMDSIDACLSMQKLAMTGANSVVVVPFLQQEFPTTNHLEKSQAITDEQLIAALKLAKQQNFYSILKPQILIKDSWAGEISQSDSVQEAEWFTSYSEHLLHYAKIAEIYQVDAFVIGTELTKLQASKHWPLLIKKIRSIYSGQLSYAASELEGIESFPYWSLLDKIGVTLYPDMSEKNNHITNKIVDQLERLAIEKNRSVWILEVGMPSAQGWEPHPWDWRNLTKATTKPDLKIQAIIIKRWLSAVENKNIDGIWIWQWSSSPNAGGQKDVHYTVQNKLAENVVQQHWRSLFTPFIGFTNQCTD